MALVTALGGCEVLTGLDEDRELAHEVPVTPVCTAGAVRCNLDSVKRAPIRWVQPEPDLGLSREWG